MWLLLQLTKIEKIKLVVDIVAVVVGCVFTVDEIHWKRREEKELIKELSAKIETLEEKIKEITEKKV
jgi:peptidoglycan hydrolase CwlO-like protein